MKTHPLQQPRQRLLGRARKRSLVVCLAVGAAAALWFIAVLLLGIPITVPQSPGAAEREPLHFVPVLLAASIASFGAWGLLEVLERLSSASLRTWTMLGIAVFVLTLPSPTTPTSSRRFRMRSAATSSTSSRGSGRPRRRWCGPTSAATTLPAVSG